MLWVAVLVVGLSGLRALFAAAGLVGAAGSWVLAVGAAVDNFAVASRGCRWSVRRWTRGPEASAGASGGCVLVVRFLWGWTFLAG